MKKILLTLIAAAGVFAFANSASAYYVLPSHDIGHTVYQNTGGNAFSYTTYQYNPPFARNYYHPRPVHYYNMNRINTAHHYARNQYAPYNPPIVKERVEVYRTPYYWY